MAIMILEMKFSLPQPFLSGKPGEGLRNDPIWQPGRDEDWEEKEGKWNFLISLKASSSLTKQKPRPSPQPQLNRICGAAATASSPCAIPLKAAGIFTCDDRQDSILPAA